MRALLLFMVIRIASAEAVVDGGFDQDSAWQLFGGEMAAIREEDGQRFLRLSTTWPGQTGYAEQDVVIDPAWVGVVISARFRSRDLVLGPDEGNRPRVSACFLDAKGEQVGDWARSPQIRTSGGWQTCALASRVPAQSVRLRLQVGSWSCRGTTDIDDVSVKGHATPLVRIPDPPLPLNGDFELLEEGWPIGWVPSDPQAISCGDGFAGMGVCLVNQRSEGFVDISRLVPLDPVWKKVTVKARMRLADLGSGTGVWDVAPLVWYFVDAYGAIVGSRPNTPKLTVNSDWTVLTSVEHVPSGAAAVIIAPGLFKACGQLFVDDVGLIGEE